MFLTYAHETDVSSQIASIPTSYYDFARGFINGTNVTNALPTLQTCDPVSDRMASSINLFIETLKNLTQENYQEILVKVVEIGRDIYDEFSKTLPKCLGLPHEITVLTQKLLAHVTQDGYINKIVGHVSQNIFEVFTRANTIIAQFTSAKHFEAGFESGKFLTFIFFHDFTIPQTPNVISFFQVQVNHTGFRDFGIGFVKGTNVLAAIPSANLCNPINNKTMELLQEFIDTASNITITDIFKLITIGKAIINEIRVNIPSCQAAANETLLLAGKLSAHIHQSGYIEKVMSHATTNVFEIVTRASKIRNFISADQHFEAGQETGTIFTFIFLHDFIL